MTAQRGPTGARGNTDDCALEVLERVGGGMLARDALARAFGRDLRLDDAGREAVVGSVYAVLRRLRLLDHALDASGSLARSGPERDRARLALSEAIDGRRDLAASPPADGAEVDWRAALALAERLRSAAPASAPDAAAAETLGLAWSLPDAIAGRLVAETGAAEAFALGRALDGRAAVIARANRMKGTREELAARLREESAIATEPTRLSSDGLVILGAASPFKTPAFADGAFELQDEASQLVSEVVAPPPRGTVVDACAGAGGKTLHLGALLNDRGRLVAIDVPSPRGRRLAELRRRVRRAGLGNVQALEADPEAPLPAALEALRGKADRVLVDAPCSGIGVWRRKPEARQRLDAERLDRLPELQLAILERFAPLVAPGGRLIYATCTLLADENRGVIERFLAAAPDFALVPIKSFLGRTRAEAIGDGEVMRLLPHRHGTDGFFAAVLRRAKG